MNILIVEDEIMARRSLAQTLTRLYPEMKIVGQTGSVAETLEWLDGPSGNADIIFMDVELSDGTCFEIFSQREIKAQVIMTTAYDSYAVKAFEVESIDYLLKPIEPEALKRAVERCKARLASGQESAPKHFKGRFLVRLNDTIVPVGAGEIAFLYSEDKATWLITRDERKYYMDFSLDVIMEQLDPASFFRISRNCIVSMESISKIVKMGSRYQVESKPAAPIDMMVSRSRTDDFLRWLEGR